MYVPAAVKEESNVILPIHSFFPSDFRAEKRVVWRRKSVSDYHSFEERIVFQAVVHDQPNSSLSRESREFVKTWVLQNWTGIW